MNTILLIDPVFTFGDDNHPAIETGFAVTNKRFTCVLDTGFSLGFAFSKRSIDKFGFKEGILASLLLGNGSPTHAIVFTAQLVIQKNRDQLEYGMTSVIFMERTGDPLIGVETLQLLSPITFDWENKLINGNL